MIHTDHVTPNLFLARGIEGLTADSLKTLRLLQIASSLRVTFANIHVRVERSQVAPPPCAAVIEFDTLDRLTFATREAQEMLGFALEPPWGQSLSAVMQRVPLPIRSGEWLIPWPQSISLTTRALGSVYGWLRLVAGETDVLTICFRDQ